MSTSKSPNAGVVHPENILTFLSQMLTMKKLRVEDGYKDQSILDPNLYGNSYAMVDFQKWAVCFTQASI